MQLKTFFVSLLMPGLGYFQIGDKRSFYKTAVFFFSVIVIAIVFRLVTNFWGFVLFLVFLLAIYVYSLIDATLKAKSKNAKITTSGGLKFSLILSFFLIAGLSFAGRRTVMGFDIMSMTVPVMQPAVMPGDRFLIDTWTYERSAPKRGDIIVHTFDAQPGLYLNRIIAIENDRVAIINGVVFINNQSINEPYVLAANKARPQSKFMQPLIISKGHYFVMGDNRDASFGDSRFSGAIAMRNIIGKATDIISSQKNSRIGMTLK